jgi:hypothetical protein
VDVNSKPNNEQVLLREKKELGKVKAFGRYMIEKTTSYAHAEPTGEFFEWSSILKININIVRIIETCSTNIVF